MNTAVATQPQSPKLVEKFAHRFGVEPNKMLATLKATAFKPKAGDPEPTNEQMMALLIVADSYGLNPWTKEIYAFPDKQNGIVPVIGIDGWSRIINEKDECDGIEFVDAESIAEVEGGKPCPEWIECVIYRKDRSHPTRVKEYLNEVYRPPFKGKNHKTGEEYTKEGPWQTHTKRMLRHKALIQCARLAFGFVGIYDEDEATRIIEGNAERVDTPKPSATIGKINQAITGKTVDSTSRREPEVTGTGQESTQETSSGTEAPPTYAQVREALEKAQNDDAFNLARDMIRDVEDEAQRKELTEVAALLATKG